MVTLADDFLREDGRPLNQMQKVQLVTLALRCMDGFERDVIGELVREFDRIANGGAS